MTTDNHHNTTDHPLPRRSHPGVPHSGRSTNVNGSPVTTEEHRRSSAQGPTH